MKNETAITGTKLDTTTSGHSGRMSFTTSCVRGTSPSAPHPNLRFSRNAAKARPALHARMEAHRNLHACSTRARRIRGSDLAFARARSRKKIWVSLDQRPPTSPANQARARGPMSSGYVRSFLRRATVNRSINLCSTRSGGPVTVEWRDKRGVHGQLHPTKEGQTIRDNFQSAAVVSMRQTQIHVPHHHVHRHATSSLPANSGCCTLDRESPSAQHPCSQTRCAVVAKRIQRTATTTQARREREWETKTSKEEHAEQGRVNASQEIRRSRREGHASIWPTLGTHQGLLWRRQPDHQVAFQKLALNS